jgi:hypothetical protein
MLNESSNWLKYENNASYVAHQKVSDVYYVRGVASISLALITSLANGLVIFLFIKDPHKNIRKSPTNFLVTSLALVDFIVGFFLEPVGAYWFLTTSFQQKALFESKYLEMAEAFLLVVSVFHLLGITRDRYLAILNPLEYSLRNSTKKRSYSTVIFIWLYCSFLVVGLRFIGKHYMRNILYCLHIDQAVIVSVILFCCVMRSLHKQTLCLQSLNVVQVITVRSIQREKRVTKTIGLMLTVFLICTLPWFLLMQILPLCSSCKEHLGILIWVFKLCFVLFQANCAFNPFLCAWRLPKYKAAIKYLLYASKLTIYRRSSRTTSVSLQQHSSLGKTFH